MLPVLHWKLTQHRSTLNGRTTPPIVFWPLTNDSTVQRIAKGHVTLESCWCLKMLPVHELETSFINSMWTKYHFSRSIDFFYKFNTNGSFSFSFPQEHVYPDISTMSSDAGFAFLKIDSFLSWLWYSNLSLTESKNSIIFRSRETK